MHWLVGVGRWVVDVSGPLVGVLVGGYLTLQGQRAADDRQRRARLEDQSRTARLQRVEAQTKAVIDLNVQVTHDIAEFRIKAGNAVEPDNQEAAQMYADLANLIQQRGELILGLSMQVFDQALHKATDRCYEQWFHWADGMANHLTNEHPQPDDNPARQSVQDFRECVRATLDRLQSEWDSLSGQVTEPAVRTKQLGK